MSLETFTECLKGVPTSEVISFSGFAEPFLNSECIDMIEHADREGYKINVFSTLVGLTAEHVKRLESVELTRFELHLPSGKEKITVDENYLHTLESVMTSAIPNKTYMVIGEICDDRVMALIENHDIHLAKMIAHSRANNIDYGGMLTYRRKGRIYCKRNLKSNVLLPNGDVVLCCMDYGMKHVLGNLFANTLSQMYSLNEFNRIESGLEDENEDILCRYCEWYAGNVDTYARIQNDFISKGIKKFSNVMKRIGKRHH